MNIPIDWRYISIDVKNSDENLPYSFENYENAQGCYQISCYPLSNKGINRNFPIQKCNSKVTWLPHRMDGDGFNVHVFYSQVEDQFCMAKYIYSTKDQHDEKIKTDLEMVKIVLDTFRVIPVSERKLAANLNKYDNFLGSLIASFDLWEKAFNNDSFIELVVITSNQIDAYLRLSIILHKQLENKTDDFEIEYLYQPDGAKGFLERKIYSISHQLGIIDDELNNELNNLYDQRNRVVHRYIISNINTRDILKIAYKYSIIVESVRNILKNMRKCNLEKDLEFMGKDL